jgi:metallo-beta-lactamase family protein
MAQNSLGRMLKESKKVHMNQEEILVNAEIVAFDSFSAHADGPFLLDYASSIFKEKSDHRRRTFIVHGELESARALQTELRLALADKRVKVTIPEVNDEISL